MRITMSQTLPTALAVGLLLPGLSYAKDPTYQASIDVRQQGDASACKGGETPCILSGIVFEDDNRDGRYQSGEAGVPEVSVSNGLEVVLTDHDGRYELPIHEQEGGTTVFITKPPGYNVPVDEQLVPQFSYHHLPEGSPKLRFGGLAPTGPLPKAVNFPLVAGESKQRFRIVVSGDTQPYSNNEVGYVRDTLAEELAAMEDPDLELVIVEGDVMGDDLGLFPRFKEIMSLSGVPLYLVPGNHDLDFDAVTDAHSYDTFKREFGPTYYSFDIGTVHFVVLDDVKYPCTPEDNADGRHEFCNDPEGSPTYNGMITERQMQWLANDLRHVPEDRLVVVNVHIPIVTYIDQAESKHQVDNAAELYALLTGHRTLSFAGHTHTLEQLRPGESYEGWDTTFTEPLGPTPFHQIVAGAACGGWWGGDFDDDGIPMAYQRLGAPRGYLIVEFDGAEYSERFKATGKAAEEQMSLSLLSPTFTAWVDSLTGWLEADPETRPAIPPVGVNDLPDPSIITASDREGDTKIVANVWNGSGDSRVYVQLDDGPAMDMKRTQLGKGEGVVRALDPYALEKQLSVLRYALRSESGDLRAQGFEQFRGSRFEGPVQPSSIGSLTTRSSHLWTLSLPPGLSTGAHKAKVTTIDAYGREYSSVLAFEIADERPFPYFRTDLWQE